MAAAVGGLGFTACCGGAVTTGLASVLGGVSPFRVACSCSTAPFFSGTAVPGGLVSIVAAPVGFVPGSTAAAGLLPGGNLVGFAPIGAVPVGFAVGTAGDDFSSRAATTPLPVNSPGLVVAAIAGRPWFSDASRALLALAVRSCWSCAGMAATCCSCAAASSSGVGRAVVPPLPPLKLTLIAPGSTTTVFS